MECSVKCKFCFVLGQCLQPVLIGALMLRGASPRVPREMTHITNKKNLKRGAVRQTE